MKKSNYITACFLILLLAGILMFFRFYKNTNREINIRIDKLYRIAEENNTGLENLIAQLGTGLDRNITDSSLDLSDKAASAFERMERSFSDYFGTMETLTSVLHEDLQKILLRNSSRMAEDYSLIIKYLEELSLSTNSNVFPSANSSAEMDYKKQQLLSKGSAEYRNEYFTGAIKIYKEILERDPLNTEALCYYNASLYYLNPGDGSNFFSIKKNLLPLLDKDSLPALYEKTILNVLMGISLEEGNAGDLEKYQSGLGVLTGGSR